MCVSTIDKKFTNTRESLLTTYIHKAKRQRMTANSPNHTYKPTTHLEISNYIYLMKISFVTIKLLKIMTKY